MLTTVTANVPAPIAMLMGMPADLVHVLSFAGATRADQALVLANSVGLTPADSTVPSEAIVRQQRDD